MKGTARAVSFYVLGTIVSRKNRFRQYVKNKRLDKL